MSDAPHPAGPGDDAGRARLQRLGRVAGELLHDLAGEMAALDTRARLVASEARLGRFPLSDMERVLESTAALSAMLHDVLETLRGATVSPELETPVEEAAERAIRQLLPGAGPVEVRLDSTLPPGTTVHGRPSFLARALGNLLEGAARHAAAEVRVTLELEPAAAPGRLPRALLAVEDDGPGLSPDLEEAPGPAAAGGSAALGLGAAAWAAEQLGGTLDYRRGTTLGGARFELRIPARLPRSYGDPGALAGKRVALVEPASPADPFLRRYLAARGITVAEPPAAGSGLAAALLRLRPDALVLDPQAERAGSVAVLWDAIRRSAPELAGRTLFVSALPDGDPRLQEARQTGRPVLARPVDPAELTQALDALFF